MQAQSPAGAMPPPGMMPSPEQIQAMQRKLQTDAQKAGMSVPDYINHLKKQTLQQQQQLQAQQRLQQAQQQSSPQQQPQRQPILPGTPNPVALILAKFLRSQDLKHRTVILDGRRRDMFRVKRALRALRSPAYVKARAKHPELPEITDRASLENAFKLLPMSMLALRVSKIDPHQGHNHVPKKSKRIKGQWTVRIETQQEVGDDRYYVWLWEGSQTKQYVYAGLALLAIFAMVCYPLWPLRMRMGVYYLSWGFLMLLGLFFAMAIFRVILFCITYFVWSPGLWLFPNLWADVSFLDSFKPVWGWHDTAPKKKKKSRQVGSAHAQATFNASTGQATPATATTTATDIKVATAPRAAYEAPKVEDLAEGE